MLCIAMNGLALFTEPPNPCDPNPCFRGVQCLPDPRNPRGFRCGQCPSGYRGDGITCQRMPSCADNPCFQGRYPILHSESDHYSVYTRVSLQNKILEFILLLCTKVKPWPRKTSKSGSFKVAKRSVQLNW